MTVMINKYMVRLLCLVPVLALFPLLLYAQNEVQRERSSLRGIAGMGFAVNVETNVSLNQKGELEVTSITEKVNRVLQEGEISVIPDEEVQSSDQIPFLYMHINSMDAGQGLVPFSITLRFYQPVKLILNRDQSTSASTWQTGTVGIVSYDQMHVIQEAAVELVREFIGDFKQANS